MKENVARKGGNVQRDSRHVLQWLWTALTRQAPRRDANDARKVRRTRRATATEGRARVASEHGATRVVAGAEDAGASVRV
jgi:hypothetical protein